MKEGKRKLRKLPSIFSEISDRFVSDYLITEQLYLYTMVKIGAVKFPLSLLPKALKKQEGMIFNEIFSKMTDNDKKLSILLKKAKIQNLNIGKE